MGVEYLASFANTWVHLRYGGINLKTVQYETRNIPIIFPK